MSVLQVPAVEEGGPGGFPYLLKEGEQDEMRRRRSRMMMMSRRWRGRGGLGRVDDSLVVEEGMLVKFPSPITWRKCSPNLRPATSLSPQRNTSLRRM